MPLQKSRCDLPYKGRAAMPALSGLVCSSSVLQVKVKNSEAVAEAQVTASFRHSGMSCEPDASC